MAHTIFTTDAYQDYKYYMQNPMAFIEDSINGEDIPDNLTVIGMIQSIDDDDAIAAFCRTYTLPIAAFCRLFYPLRGANWHGIPWQVPLFVADILHDCCSKATKNGSGM